MPMTCLRSPQVLLSTGSAPSACPSLSWRTHTCSPQSRKNVTPVLQEILQWITTRCQPQPVLDSGTSRSSGAARAGVFCCRFVKIGCNADGGPWPIRRCTAVGGQSPECSTPAWATRHMTAGSRYTATCVPEIPRPLPPHITPLVIPPFVNECQIVIEMNGGNIGVVVGGGILITRKFLVVQPIRQ
jgi:hypothetical protein